ncbi:hypothetical protein P4O66_018890 [Electrophorus voltai]|uniref:Ig-like domain-containing protein n=1 Tax=Electrophorus voltai TaxID=2609070 RepID=A0AAD8YQM7_9TELE|nr:hypothetical protein P4O66_018890 [Electrophorus voltai]
MCKGILFRIFLVLLLYLCKNVAGTPNMVSISVVGHTGPMVEGTWYELRCDVQKVAPDQLLTVRWYKGQTLLTDTSFNDSIKTPVDKSATYWIFANTTDDGAEYRCEAVLRQRQAGPQPPTTEMSEPLLVTVYCNCPVVLQPPAVVVEYGTSVSVNCSTSKPHFGMAWEASQGAVDPQKGVQLITWNVPRLEEWDIKPLCYVNIKNQERPDKRHLPVIVYKTPDSVSISIVGHTGPVTEGTQYELQCDVQNVAPVHRLTVKWYKGQTLLTDTFFNDPTKTPVNQSATLQISPSRADDAADYWCEAELRLGPAAPQPPPTMKSNPLNITVHYKPVINKGKLPATVPVFWGYPEVLVCEAEGHPSPVISWTSTRAEGGNLTITVATIENDGVYNCTATNSAGTDIVSVKVVMKDGPEISCRKHITVLENEEVEPNCTAEGFPPPEVTWFKEEERVYFPQRMQRANAGKYILVAVNNSTSNHTLEIEVQYSPSDIMGLNDQSVTQGSKVDLNCTSSAWPRPDYKWIHHPEPNVRIVSEDGVSKLSIASASGNNMGTYTCIASNTLGKTNLTVRVDVQGAEALCPLIVNPSHVVLEYRRSVVVECNTSVSPSDLHWEFLNHRVNNGTLLVNSSQFKNWDETPRCTGKFIGLDTCTKHVDITLYKTPDNVSISIVNHTGPVIEGTQYELQCDVQNVAPVQLLTVKWYKGQTLLTDTFFNEPTKTPVNQSATLQISPSRADDAADYWCEAELRLGPAAPQPPPTMKSNPLNITVHYKPVINKGKLPATMPVFWGYPEVLVCEAEGHPSPVISWTSTRAEGGNLTITVATIENDGVYNCTATNSAGTDIVSVKVVMKEDYLPVVAGFVALVVVATSLIFICIYSIYYKNKKTGTYTVEGANPSAQNGNIAQNGKDHSIPMKKLSQSTIFDSCPVMLTPPVVLLEYGASISVDCSTSIAHRGMGWEASQGQVDTGDDVQLITWSVPKLVEWDIKPICYVIINKAGIRCQRSLTINIYKTPDSVSISIVGHTGPVTEGRQYELQCDIQNVAPVRLLTVKWYKGHTLEAKTSISDSSESPVNHSTRFWIIPSRADDGAQYRCEAELDLSLDSTGTQRAPRLSSGVLNVTVHYSPEASGRVEIFDQLSEDVMLNCTVAANPPPWYTWHSTNMKKEFNEGLPLLFSSSLSSGNYTCTASNIIGTVSKLFIVKAKPEGGKRSTFWAIVGAFVGLAVVLIVSYILKMRIG